MIFHPYDWMISKWYFILIRLKVLIVYLIKWVWMTAVCNIKRLNNGSIDTPRNCTQDALMQPISDVTTSVSSYLCFDGNFFYSAVKTYARVHNAQTIRSKENPLIKMKFVLKVDISIWFWNLEFREIMRAVPNLLALLNEWKFVWHAKANVAIVTIPFHQLKYVLLYNR